MPTTDTLETIRALIRDIPDFPKPGILFRDITPLLADARGLTLVTEFLTERYRGRAIDKIIGIESRGLIFSAPVAVALGVGLVPARKPGKLPFKTVEADYALEYGCNQICMHVDAIEPGERVLIIDDLIATGGTIAATAQLVERLGGTVEEIATVIELEFLKGRDQLAGRPFFSMLSY